MAAKKERMVVRAVTSFADALTGKTFRPHEVVEGWNEERALHYQDAGLVKVVYVPEAADPQMKLPETGPETAKEESGKPGPEETKPKSGPSKTKSKSGGRTRKSKAAEKEEQPEEVEIEDTDADEAEEK